MLNNPTCPMTPFKIKGLLNEFHDKDEVANIAVDLLEYVCKVLDNNASTETTKITICGRETSLPKLTMSKYEKVFQSFAKNIELINLV